MTRFTCSGSSTTTVPAGIGPVAGTQSDLCRSILHVKKDEIISSVATDSESPRSSCSGIPQPDLGILMTKAGGIPIKYAFTAKQVEFGFRCRRADSHIAGVGAVDVSSAALPLLGRCGDGLAPKGCRTKSRDHKLHAETATASWR